MTWYDLRVPLDLWNAGEFMEQSSSCRVVRLCGVEFEFDVMYDQFRERLRDPERPVDVRARLSEVSCITLQLFGVQVVRKVPENSLHWTVVWR
jgi:hypothetical protein